MRGNLRAHITSPNNGSFANGKHIISMVAQPAVVLVFPASPKLYLMQPFCNWIVNSCFLDRMVERARLGRSNFRAEAALEFSNRDLVDVAAPGDGRAPTPTLFPVLLRICAPSLLLLLVLVLDLR